MQESIESNQTRNTSRPGTRQHSVSSRAASPTSSYSHSRNHSHGKNERTSSTLSPGVSKFRSPLYRPGRAPVLRVFVPSPEGDWLSDASVVECEAELKRSGVLKLLRVGDIVWDVAVGDEGNLGRLMWDGSYLVVRFSSDSCCITASDTRVLFQDLDYRYSRMGELSPYFHSLAFSPSYFHRVIRIGGSATHNPHCNPIIYVDVSPWGREIASNLQLLQDRARTETCVWLRLSWDAYLCLTTGRMARCTTLSVGYTAPRLLFVPLSHLLHKDSPKPVRAMSASPFPMSKDSMLIPAGTARWSSNRKGQMRVLQIFRRAAGRARSRPERRPLPPRCGTKKKRRIGGCGGSCAKRGMCRVGCVCAMPS